MAALGNRATGDQGENVGICGQIVGQSSEIRLLTFVGCGKICVDNRSLICLDTWPSEIRPHRISTDLPLLKLRDCLPRRNQLYNSIQFNSIQFNLFSA